MFPVLIVDDNLDPNKRDSNRKNLRYLFSNSTFTVLECDRATEITDSLESEKEMILRALNKAKYINPDSNCLLIKDTSTTMFGPDDLYEILQYNLRNYDLLYLCRWSDSCNLHRDFEEFAGITIATTNRPQGFQTVLISPKLRDMILCPSFVYNDYIENIISKMIYNRFIKAKTVLYNVFNFDVTSVKNNKDYLKLNQCTHVIPRKDSGISSSTYFFVGSLIGLIVLAGVGLYVVGPKKSDKREP